MLCTSIMIKGMKSSKESKNEYILLARNIAKRMYLHKIIKTCAVY